MADDILLFDRAFRITVGTIQITDLDCTFNIEKTIKPEPNKAELTIYNLNADHIAAIEQLQQVPVKIEAGYLGGMSMLFLGNLRTAQTVLEGADLVTTLASGDGEKAIKTSRIAKPIPKNTKVEDVLRTLAAALGVGEGNLSKAVADIKANIGAEMFAEGSTLYGSAAREMTNVCRAVGLQWSIQDGKLQLVSLEKALAGQALVLGGDDGHGLVGHPTVNNEGIMSARTLMIPDLFPGRAVVLNSVRLKGQYRVEKTVHSGDTGGGDWFVDIEGKKY